ncbi:4-hydroxyphenylpyruvate dioxygenase [Ktedonobacteria bacterium brp13]|nr:4-hydroxyphenylpyruvate dioxygenase [Ktedonobacteria bacterium brp13]
MPLTQQDSVSLMTDVVEQLQAIDYVELYVGNAVQAAHYYQSAFGFTPVAYAGLETGSRDRVSYVMQKDDCYFVLTAPLTSEGPIAEHVKRHGDGVKDIAFRVKDVRKIFASAVQLGASPLLEPTELEDEGGRVLKATIATYGDNVHTFIQRDGFAGTFLPAYQPLKLQQAPWTGLHTIDHFAICLPYGELTQWVQFYMQVFGFQQIHEEGIVTEYSAAKSIAVQDRTESIKFVLLEPIPGKKKSQIEEFLKFHEGPGVQHVALQTQEIVKSIEALEANGVGFVAAPSSYYEMLPERVGAVSEEISDLRKENILVDSDEWGYLLQIFSQPVHNRPTLFIEIIQRKNARGFGSGNIQALFKALEREQSRRGNL